MNCKQYISCVLIWPLCVVGYTVYGLSGVLFLTTIMPVMYFIRPFPRLHKALLCHLLYGYLAFLTRLLLPALQIYSIEEQKSLKEVIQAGPCILVANHMGKLDGPLILGRIKNTIATMKSKHARKPVYSLLVKYLDFISLDSSSLESLDRAVQGAKSVLRQGKNLLIFPEGMRRTSQKLLPFKDFAFRIAQETNIPIIPIVLNTDFPFMTKNFRSFFPCRKNRIVIRPLPPMKALQDERPAEMAARVRKIMTKEINDLANTSNSFHKG